ncbi:PREDICTED: threonine dehydratase biosynthetic, chloroplastic-like [Fragaria vesca subsp. vesca]|uniref:threonine dehydratase biosynthetic, chloroplastic-like n=1 Tax=Fragaria vesca subsp. vesca TaxID=101020 RepID=UPI0002C2EA2D|nr:PREDICTED: threonine dehydratase biosynthetic, chloroplastic-like [Fragaria vesca subsp. vesca]XP_011468153.1 PREDICTED: threonine dehydratase biosynthetic, chloroplastic-like [Fragaria vesca subsp. vesca]
MSDTTQPNHNGVNATDCSVLNATDFSVVNATYFSVVSAYTIGYGEFHFSATAGKLFASVWLPLGTAVVSSATSYLCGHRHWICAVCIWNGKKTRIVPGQEFDKGTLVEANPTLRKHCLEHTNVENSPKFLSGILSSRIYECKFAQRQDLEPVHTCSREFSSTPEEVQILLKREDCCSKELGSSYRWRGTYNFMANALNEMQRRAFICTVGKHAVTVACVAQLLNSEARVAIPVDYFSAEQNDREKIKVVLDKKQCYKAFKGTCIQESDGYAKKVATNQNIIYVPSRDHTDIITGYGTIGVEIITQMVGDGKIDNLHAIFVPVGDGNRIAGIAAYVKRVFPKVKVFGVEERTRSVMAWSFHKGKRVLLEKQNGEVLVEAIGEECFSICAEFLDGIIIVDEHVISTANEYIKRDTIKKVSALCIAGVQ